MKKALAIISYTMFLFVAIALQVCAVASKSNEIDAGRNCNCETTSGGQILAKSKPRNTAEDCAARWKSLEHSLYTTGNNFVKPH